MFRDACIGDRVWDFIIGWGTITNIDRYEDSSYPITVEFDCGGNNSYTLDGKYCKVDNYPRLFWDQIKFKIPRKTFDLEEAMRKLEVVDFKVENDNYFLCWSPARDEIDYSVSTFSEKPLTKYFSIESALKFVQVVQGKDITKKEFFDAYKKVFFEEEK